MTSQLPSETWSAIVEYLPRRHQRACLFVSRLFHDLAVRFLFSTIRIFFVGEGYEVFKDIAERLASQSWEMLDYIVEQPRFAQVVKTIVVYVIDTLEGADGIFERRCLMKALKAVPHLQSFGWLTSGDSSPRDDFPSDIAETLANFCPQLQRLTLPCIPSHSAHSLQKLHLLETLKFPFTPLDYPAYQEGDHKTIYHDELDRVIATINANSASLRRLTMRGYNVGMMPVRAFSLLSDLEIFIVEEEETRALDLVLRHTPGLASLALVGFFGEDIFLVLKNHTNTLPHLHTFRLSTMWHLTLNEPIDVSAECLHILTRFLSGRPLLRRLQLLVPSLCNVLDYFLPAISKLQGLEVLGLDTGRERLQERHFTAIAHVLPSRLQAFHLKIQWEVDGYEVDIRDLTPLLKRLREIPSLSFVLLSNIDDQYYYESRLTLTPEELAWDLTNVETVGLQQKIWSIDRSGPEPTLTEWPKWKVELSIPEDFQDPDDEWLMKYH